MTTSTDQFVSDILQRLHGFGLAQDRAAFLTADVAAGDLTFAVSDATGFDQGIAEVGDELVFIETVDTTSNTLTVSPDGRGYYGTTATTHATGSRVTMAPTWSRQRVLSALNDAIIGTYPTLFGVAKTSFTWTPNVSTYQLPADAERVLSVTTDTIGPSKEQLRIDRWSFNAEAPTSVFANGRSITLERGGFPGRDVTVVYRKQPTEIASGGQFTDSGLAETARTAVRYAAMSLLTADMDVSRLPVDTATADEFDPSKNGPGSAARISAQMYQRYQVELEQERRRLRMTVPMSVNVRTR